MRLLWYLSRLAVIATLFGGTAGVVVGMSPAASAAPAASGASAAMPDGWVRCAHLSPDSPAMDIYMYAFGEAGHPMVLRHVSYGGVSEYMAVSPGRYSVAMRAAGAPASSPPILVTSFLVSSRTAYTVAGVGPNPGLREEVLKDQMTPPMGKALVRGNPGIAQAEHGEGQLRTGRSRAASDLRLGHALHGRLTGDADGAVRRAWRAHRHDGRAASGLGAHHRGT